MARLYGKKKASDDAVLQGCVIKLAAEPVPQDKLAYRALTEL